MSKEFEIDAYRKGRELLVILRGRLVLSDCQDAKTRLSSLLGPQVDQAFIHLGELNFLDSAGLGVLVGLKMQTNKNRSRFALLFPPPRIEDILHVSKLDTIFEIQSGADAELICASLRLDEFCLWRDSKDTRQECYNTVADLTPSSRVNLTNVKMPGEMDDETAVKVKQWCADAVEYIRQGDYQKAIDAYVRALNLDQANLSALNNLAIVYEKQPEWYPKAAEAWKKVLEISSGAKDEKHASRARKHLESLAKLVRAGQ